MKILFEEYPYPADKLFESLFRDESLRSLEGLEKCFNRVNTPYTINETRRYDKQDTISFKCVGYYFCPEIGDSVYFLPRVYLKGQSVAELRAFRTSDESDDGKDPIEIIELTKQALKEDTSKLSMDDYMFVNDSAQWVYKSIRRYAKSKGKGNIYDGNLLRIVTTPGASTETLIDTIDALEKFYREHRNLFTFIAINKRNGTKKINWRKTVATQTPIMQDNTPIYMSFISKEKTINYDEEVIVMFFSVMSYLRNKYISHAIDTSGYEIMRSQEIESLIRSGRGVRVMMKMKHKYYIDSLVYLCDLLRIFFEQAYDVMGSPRKAEATIVKKYDRVFEHMLDCLIGDNLPKALKYMKDQDDDKHIDHIYNDESLIFPGKQIYYIGDSKYYREDRTEKLGKNAVAKQFTYAKNVIQYCINIFNKGADDDVEIKGEEQNIIDKYLYRDELTEGYNITPNFFVHGLLTSNERKFTTNFDIEKDFQLHGEDGNFDKNFQFKNRLFDRDTLILQTYDINFLYLLAVYSSEREDEMTKKAIREKLRKEISDVIFKRYNIYQVCLSKGENLKDFVKANFYELNGRIFSFKNKGNEEPILLYAEETKIVNTIIVSSGGKKYMELSNGEKVEVRLIGKREEELTKEYEEKKYRYTDYFSIAAEKEGEDEFKTMDTLIGCYKDENHLKWILEHNLYNIRFGQRKGAVTFILQPKKLILYNFETKSDFCCYSLDNDLTRVVDKSAMVKFGYENPFGDYLLYKLDTEIDCKSWNLDSIKNKIESQDIPGAPIFCNELEFKSVK